MPTPDSEKAPDWESYERDIQRFVAKLDENTVVSHDVKREGLLSGRPRQIDVLIEGSVAGQPIEIVVECKYRTTRPVPIEDVDAFIGKLLDLGVERGLMYSSSGFSAGAIKRAAGARNPSVALTHIVPVVPHKPKPGVQYSIPTGTLRLSYGPADAIRDFVVSAEPFYRELRWRIIDSRRPVPQDFDHMEIMIEELFEGFDLN